MHAYDRIVVRGHRRGPTPGPSPVKGFDHYYATDPNEGSWFDKPIGAVIDARVSDHHGVESMALLDRHGRPADTDLADWVYGHLDQVLLSLMIGAPRHVEERTRSIRRQLRGGVDPDELSDELADLIESLRMPPGDERTLLHMHVFVHEDGSASGGSKILDRPADRAEGRDLPDELGRVHLARGLLDRFATKRAT